MSNFSNFRSFNLSIFNFTWSDVSKVIEIVTITYFKKEPKVFIRRSLWSIAEETGKTHFDFLFFHFC